MLQQSVILNRPQGGEVQMLRKWAKVSSTVFSWCLGLAVSMIVFWGCSGDNGNAVEPQRKSLSQTLSDDSRFTILVSGLSAAGVLDSLEENGPYTIFAPVNAVFDSIGMENLVSLSDHELRSMYMYHIVEGNYLSSGLISASPVQTLEGGSIDITVRGDTIFLNDGVKVLESDILATNGVIYAIGGILMP